MSKGIVFRNRQNEKIYPCSYKPIGSLYFSTSSENPSTYFGGTWERFANGRVIVGIDENQTEFNSSSKTGGSKYIQQHTHTLTASTYNPSGTGWYYIGWLGVNNQGRNQHTFGIKTGGAQDVTTGDSGNLQPYICVYIWRRIA